MIAMELGNYRNILRRKQGLKLPTKWHIDISKSHPFMLEYPAMDQTRQNHKVLKRKTQEIKIKKKLKMREKTGTSSDVYLSNATNF